MAGNDLRFALLEPLVLLAAQGYVVHRKVNLAGKERKLLLCHLSLLLLVTRLRMQVMSAEELPLLRVLLAQQVGAVENLVQVPVEVGIVPTLLVVLGVVEREEQTNQVELFLAVVNRTRFKDLLLAVHLGDELFELEAPLVSIYLLLARRSGSIH